MTHITAFASPGGSPYQISTLGGAVGPDSGNISYFSSSNGVVITGTPLTNTIVFTGNVKYTAVASGASPYTVLSADMYIGVDCSAGAVTIKLPNVPTQGPWTIKDSTGSAATHNITITTVGGAKTFDGSTSVVINMNYGSVNIIYNGTNFELY